MEHHCLPPAHRAVHGARHASLPSVDSTPQHQSQTRHGLGVLNRLASSEDPEWALHASCTLASMTATLLRMYAHVREPFDTTEHCFGVLRRLLRYSEAMLDQDHYTPHLNPLGSGLTSDFEDTLKGDGRLCNLLAFVSRISPHLPHLSQEDSAIAWKCMAGLEPETMGMVRASRWLVARFHGTWLELQDWVDSRSTSSDQDVMGVTSLQILIYLASHTFPSPRLDSSRHAKNGRPLIARPMLRTA
ncbi:hypothetical protein B0H14DRAFT_2617599 [Mycena olivaceomarginata]|nr:hypothetical protein B0H14DRAFT_2617599 [Mycena olivaceomarginata]